MKKILSIQLLKNMGIKYVSYRIMHEIEKKLGVLKKKHPVNPSPSFFVNWEEWKKTLPIYYISARESIKIEKILSEKLKDDALRLLNGQVCFFSYEWKDLGKDYNWITNPQTGFVYNIEKHWSEVPDLSLDAGDIKYVWEKSRFSYLLTIIRYDYHFNEDNSEFIFSEIENWIDNNPINRGPNWRCSQEISLRIFNWLSAIYFYQHSTAITEERWSKIQNTIYWSLQHVYAHINFSRVAVRNNHAITETLMLALCNILFPFVPETKKWSEYGRKWFEKEIEYQIYSDGTFLQFSMNYHRVVIQLLSLGISVTEKNNKPFLDIVYKRAYKSVDFLYQCLQEENGYLPNYGSNDGAWFFPLSTTEYRDYRSQLNSLHFILTGKLFYKDESLSEEAKWFSNEYIKKDFLLPITKQKGSISFPIGGYYLLREKDTFTFIRCGRHKDRPAHADNLHLDVWYKGDNILRDSGTYKYNTEKEFSDYFTGTASHNTVMIEDHSQMLKGSRFIWFYWSQAISAKWVNTDSEFVFEGKISAFRYLNKRIIHTRKIIKEKDKNRWHVYDELTGAAYKDKYQIWHNDNFNVNFEAFEGGLKREKENRISYNSIFYGLMKEGSASVFKFRENIKTVIDIKD